MRRWLVPTGLVTSLVAWSGLLLAEGPARVEDDTGASTPHHHAPRRTSPKKRPAPKKKRPVKPKGVPDAAPPKPPPGTPRVAAEHDEDEEDDDEEEAPAPNIADGGALPMAKTNGNDGGTNPGPDGGADAGEGEDDEDEDENDNDIDNNDADDDTAYELGAEIASESRLVWRGLPESRGAVLQTSGWAGFYGLSLEGWASYLLNGEGAFDPMRIVGADLTASYAFSLGDLRIRPGVTALYFPEGLSSSTTAEGSLGASYRLGELHIVSGTNIDMVLQPGAYFGTLGVTWGSAKPPWTVRALADVGWATAKYNYEYLGKSVAALDVVHVGASARYDLGSVVYLELHVDGSTLVAPTLRGTLQEPTLIVGGAAIGLDWSVGR